jgi:hypothetical protein
LGEGLTVATDGPYEWQLEKYRPDQPRVPAGRPEGGQWTSERRNLILTFDKDARRSASAAISDCQAFGLRTGREEAVLIDTKGNRLAALEGDKDSCEIPKILLEATGVLVHNHPSSGAFSADDITMLLANQKMSHVVAVGHDGTIYMLSKTRKTATPEAFGDVMEVYSAVRRVYDRSKARDFPKYQRRVLSGEISGELMWKQHSHEIMLDIARDFDLAYRRVLP